MLRAAIKRGEITKPSVCQVLGCTAPAEHGHHQRYDKPRDVIFLCRIDHERVHHDGALRLKPSAKRAFAKPPRAA